MVDIDRGVGDVYDPDTVHNQVTMKSTTHFGKALKRVGISTLVHLGAFDIIGFLLVPKASEASDGDVLFFY